MIENVKPSLDLRTLARSNARSYLTKSVHPKLVGEEVANGWQVLKKRKTSVRLKKAKSHGTFLEDRVWMLLYRMQFEFLSGVGGGKLWLDPKDGEGPKTQVDVVGIFGPLLGYGTSGNKEKKTKWIVTVNEKRNIVSHPSSGVALTLEELAELESFDTWLKNSISGVTQGAEGEAVSDEDSVISNHVEELGS